jgi:hypothetical protein
MLHAHARGEGDAGPSSDHGEEGLLAAQFDGGIEREAARLSLAFDLGAKAVAGHREQQVRFAEGVGKRDEGCIRPTMAERHGEEDILFEEGVNIQPGVGEGEDDEGEVGGVIEEAGDSIIGAEHFDTQVNPREALPEGCEGGREEVVAEGLRGAETEVAGGGGFGAGDAGRRGGDVVEDAAGAIGEAVGGFGGDDPAANAVEERYAEFAFEQAELLAD